MNDLAASILKEMIGRYGVSLINDPIRCEGLLRDSCGKCTREIFVLIHALRQKIPFDLLEPRHAHGELAGRQHLGNHELVDRALVG